MLIVEFIHGRVEIEPPSWPAPADQLYAYAALCGMAVYHRAMLLDQENETALRLALQQYISRWQPAWSGAL